MRMAIYEEALGELKREKARHDESVRLQAAVWRGERPERMPLLLTIAPDNRFDAEFPHYNSKEIHFDSGKMFRQGLRDAILCSRGGAEAVPSMRADMGCGIIPTAFGLQQNLYEDKMPWVREHIPKERLMAMAPEDLAFGEELEAGFRHMDDMAARLEGTGCRVFPLDLQGAFDTAHLVYGDAIFYDLYDDPAFVHHLLDLSCHAAEMCMDECLKRIPGAADTVAHYNCLAIPRAMGGAKISEDTSTLLSSGQIDEFVLPYLKRLLGHFGGGYVHYCGRNPHLLDAVLGMDQVIGLNFGNPEMHDMDAVLRHCASLGKAYYGFVPMLPGEDASGYFGRLLDASGRDGLHWLLLQYMCGQEAADEVLQRWREACSACG
jgi:hypothetical protein